MSTYLKRTLLNGLLALSLSVSTVAIADEVAAPAGMPDEVATMFADAETSGGDVTFAPSEENADDMQGTGTQATAAGDRYLYTTLRVIANGGNRGCSSSDWNCMTRLCKADLRDQSAWRGWAGCWKKGSKFVCYFECGQRRKAF